MTATENWLKSIGKVQGARVGVALSADPRSPDDVAEQGRISRELGVPSVVVGGDPEAFKARAEQKRTTEALASAPLTAKWLADMNNGVLAKDDVDNLSWFERAARAPTEGMIGAADAINESQAGRGFQTGVTGLKQMGVAAATIPFSGMARRQASYLGLYERAAQLDPATDRAAMAQSLGIDPMSVDAELAYGFLQATPEQRAQQIDASAKFLLQNEEVKSGLVEQVNAYTEEMKATQGRVPNFTDIKDVRGFADWVGFNAGQAVPFLASVFAAGAVGGTPAVLAAGYGMGVGDIQSGLIEEGITDRGDIALLGGVPYAGLELLGPAAAAFRGVTPQVLSSVSRGFFQRLARDVPQQAVEEFINEAGQEIIKDISVGAANGEGVTLDDETLLRWFNSGMAGVVGGVAGAAGLSAQGVALDADIARAESAGGTAETLMAVDERAAASKLKTRAPEKFREVMDNVLNGQFVYVPADDLVTLFQAKDTGFDPTEWGIDPLEFEEMTAAGGNVAIPMSVYASQISGTPDAEWFKQNATTSPDEMSLSEADRFNAEVRGFMEAAMIEADKARAADLESRASDVQVYDNFYSQLRAAGRTKDVAENEARVMSAFFRTMAERYGDDALDLSRRFGLTIRGPETEPMRRRGNLDIALNTLRSGKLPKPGQSLAEFVRARGGVQDTGGDFEAMGATDLISETRAQIAERRNAPTLVGMPEMGKGDTLDNIARAAIEAGYLPDVKDDADQVRAVMDAIREEMAGRPTYRPGEDGDPTLNALAEELSRRGVDLAATNDEIMAALEAADGITYDQSGRAITDTPEFRAWFGDSKVVDADGNPMVVYHATTAEFDAFDTNIQSGDQWFGRGSYFATSEADLDDHIGMMGMGDDTRVIEAYLSIQNPYIWDVSTEEKRAKLAADLEAAGIDMATEFPRDTLERGGPAKFTAWAKSQGYDGVFSMAYDGRSIVEIVAFEPTQIKSAFNRGTFDPADPRIMFQGDAPEQPLYVVHNLSAEKLRHAVDLGGLAAPSLAVARADIGFDNFGEISLIGDPKMADPKGKGVRAFNADVYSPRQPRAKFKVNSKAARKMQDVLAPVAERIGLPFSFGEDDIERGGLSALEGQAVAKAAWLESIGEVPPVEYEDPAPPPERPKGFDGFDATQAYDVRNTRGFEAAALAYVQARIASSPKSMQARWRDTFLNEDGTLSDDGAARVSRTVAAANVAIAAHDASPSGAVSRYKTSNAIDAAVAGREAEFNSWVRQTFGEVVGDAFFEDAGGRKRDYVMANLVKAMTKSLRNGENWNYGAGNVRAAVAPEFKSVAEIKAQRGNVVDAKTAEALKDEVNNELFALADKFAPYHHEGKDFGWGDTFADFMRDMASGPAAVAQWQTKWFSAPAPQELLDEAGAFLEKLKTLPTEYFEIKMQRAVGLSEFTAALVPQNVSPEAVKTLRDAGLEIIPYSRDEGRAAALKKVDRVFFQKNRASITLPAGGIESGETVIRLFEKSDLSSFLHEAGHYWLEVFNTLAADPDAPQQMRDDMDAIRRFVGAEASAGTPAPAPGMVRMYHGGHDADAGGGRWFTSSLANAKGWAAQRGGAVRADEVWFVDVPRTDPMFDADYDNQTVDQGFTVQKEFEPSAYGSVARFVEGTSAPISVESHETWARGVEAYMLEGKAPSLELADAFSRFKAWLTRIYKTVRGLNVKLSPEIREVMDRMLATDAEIAAARDAQRMKPLFTDEAAAGMTPAAFQTYQRMARRATETASQRLLEATMAKVRREKEAWWKAERADVRKEVEATTNSQREYRLTEMMANQRWLGDAARDVPDIRLDRAELVEMFGPGVLAEISRERLGGKRAIYAEGGASLMEVADLFGFANPQEMVNTLQNAGKRIDAIERETDRIMLDRYGDPLTDGTIEQEALEAIHSEQQAKSVATEVRHLASRAGLSTRNLTAQVFRQRAKLMLGRMSVAEATRPDSYLAAERKAAKRAEDAFARVARGGGQEALVAAARHKERQLLNHYLYLESRDLAKEVDRGREKMRDYAKATVRAKLEGGYIEQIDALLDQYDFRVRAPGQIKRDENLRGFVERMTAAGRAGELAIDPRLIEQAKKVHYSRLSVDELRGLFDTIANIDHLGRFKQKLIEAKRKRDLDASVGVIVESVVKNVGSGKSGATGPVRNTFNRLFTMDTMLIEYDGLAEMGPVYEEVKAGIDAGATVEEQMQMELAGKLDEVFGIYTAKEITAMQKPVAVEGANGRPWAKSEILAVALNMGNEANRQRLFDKNVHPKNRLTPEQADALMATLDARDWQFVKAYADLINSYWPQLSEVSERRTGVKPKKVEAVPFDTPAGQMPGWYFPIKYDSELSAIAARDEGSAWDDFLSSGWGARAEVNSGMTMARQKTGGGRALKLDLSVGIAHMKDTVRLIALSEAVDNSYRILNDNRVKQAFLDAGRGGDLDVWNLWLKDVAQGPVQHNDGFNTFARIVKNNFTLSRLAFNLKTVIMQSTGMAQSAAVIGKRNMIRGLNDYRKRPRELAAEVTAKSAFMNARKTTLDKDIYDFANDARLSSPLAGRFAKAKNAAARWGFAPMTYMQFYSVDMPTWLGAYRAELEKTGNEEKAMAFADRMVARAQDSGLMADRTAFGRGTLDKGIQQADFIRVFSTLGGYMMTKMNRGYVTARRGIKGVVEGETASDKFVAATDAAANLLLLYVVESVAMALLYSLVFDDDEDEPEDYANFIATETAMSVIGGVPFVRDIGTAFQGYGAGGVLSSVLELPADFYAQTAQGENDKALRRVLSDTIGVSTGLPTTAFMRALEQGLLGEEGSPAEAIFGSNPITR